MVLPKSDLNHEIRAKGIGSSEIAMLVKDADGLPVSSFGGPHRLWRLKTGQEVEDDSAAAAEKAKLFERGNFLEPGIGQWYAHRTGARVRLSPGTIQSKRYPLVVDSVDGLVWLPGNDSKKPDRALETKTSGFFMRYDWGEDGTDQVPPAYLIQGQWHMNAWDLPACDFPVFWGDDLHIYHTSHNDELALALVSLAEKFWRDHVLTGKAPPVDGDDSTSRWLAKRFKTVKKDIVDADGPTVAKMLKLRKMRLAAKVTGAEISALENEVKLSIGDSDGIRIPEAVALNARFSQIKGRKKLDVNAAMGELLSQREQLLREIADMDGDHPILKKRWVGVEEMKLDHTTVGSPSRKFTVDGLLKADMPVGLGGEKESAS